MEVTYRLKGLSDNVYKDFQASLLPTIDKDRILGVRVPILRAFAKGYFKEKESVDFINTLPHYYYDENMLHALLISQIDDFDRAIYELDRFLPYVDNWAVDDIISPKILKKDKDRLFKKIVEWIDSNKPYTIRFGVGMLMRYYLDNDFKIEYLDIVSKIKSNEYYVNMMCAWFFATALYKQWDSTIIILKDNILSKWVHNKTIQKGIESYRITKEQKDILRGLKV